MYYSAIGILAVFILLIENGDALFKRNAVFRQPVWNNYRHFLNSVLLFYASDILWGVLNSLKMAIPLFVDTSVFFVAMAFGVFYWTKYIVSFFTESKKYKSFFIWSGRIFVVFASAMVIANIFRPILFTVSDDCVYHPLIGRYLILTAQLLALILLTVYALVLYCKFRKDKHRSFAMFSFVMAAFLVAQIRFPEYPMYSVAYMIGLCFIHSFVIQNEKQMLSLENERKAHSRLNAFNRNIMALYIVDPRSDEYIQYSASADFETLGIPDKGKSFFEETLKNSLTVIYGEDKESFNRLFSKRNIVGAVEIDGVFIMEYRIVINGNPVYVRLKASEIEEDGKALLVVGIENVDMYVKREQKQAHELSIAREMATKDSLTNVKNNYAFAQAKEDLNEQIANGEISEFAIVICDINGLKYVNDTMGHQAGDTLIRNACARICDIFAHSSVFRIGGDEFAVVCQGQDYKNINALVEKMNSENEADIEVQIAFGMARYREGQTVENVIQVADNLMYRHKAALKNRHSDYSDDEVTAETEKYQFPEELREAYESSPLSFVYYQNINGKAVPVLFSEGFCRNTGVPREIISEWLVNGMYERMHPDDVGIMLHISDDFLHQRGKYDTVFRCRLSRLNEDNGEDKDDLYVYIHGVGKWQTMPDGTQLAVITYSNLSLAQKSTIEKLDMYMKLRHDTFYTDPLTNLPNINYLHEFGNEKLQSIRAEGRIPNVVYMDISSMQSYNNQYGFKEGDLLLCLTSETISKCFRKSLVIRDSDDHFIMITDVDSEEMLRREIHKVNRTIRVKAHGNTSGVRCGVCPVGGEITLNEAIDHAKMALKRIENDMNREVEFFSQISNDLYFQNRYIIENLDRAIREGWIKVYYHAIRRVPNQKVAAFECLARWVDPERGIISPNAFIPVLQKYHQLYKLDLFMCEQVCREVKIRFDNGLPLVPVSVNFSRQDFDHVDILSQLNKLYDKYNMAQYADKSYFILEITEQDLEEGEESFKEQLNNIREAGYTIWLDDFGSGYSAISSFSQYEFDLIKFDMNLVKNLDDKRGVNQVLLEELVSLAKKLGIHTLIEGCETEEQLNFIRDIGCELVQGYYFRKPESLDEILERVTQSGIIAQCETRKERDEFNKKWFE